MEKETLEEAFEQWSEEQDGYDKLDVLRFGAKWQAERMFSEEDVINFNDWQESLLTSENSQMLVDKTTSELISIWKNQK